MENEQHAFRTLWEAIKDIVFVFFSVLWGLLGAIGMRILKRQDKLETDFASLTESCHKFRVENAERRINTATKDDLIRIHDRIDELHDDIKEILKNCASRKICK